jgi:hypothetical protein
MKVAQNPNFSIYVEFWIVDVGSFALDPSPLLSNLWDFIFVIWGRKKKNNNA